MFCPFRSGAKAVEHRLIWLFVPPGRGHPSHASSACDFHKAVKRRKIRSPVQVAFEARFARVSGWGGRVASSGGPDPRRV